MSKLTYYLDHPRAKVGWVVRAEGSTVIKVARVAVIPPVDGAGCLRVAVSDFHGGEPTHYFGNARGCGYDKLTAALAGAQVGGVVLGNHCDRSERPTLDNLCAARNYLWIKGF